MILLEFRLIDWAMVALMSYVMWRAFGPLLRAGEAWLRKVRAARGPSG